MLSFVVIGYYRFEVMFICYCYFIYINKCFIEGCGGEGCLFVCLFRVWIFIVSFYFNCLKFIYVKYKIFLNKGGYKNMEKVIE